MMSKELESSEFSRTPRSSDERTALLRERPGAWEYLLFAGSLLMRREELEDDYHDHQLRYVALEGDPLDEEAATSRIQSAFPDALALVAAIQQLFDQHLHERAFGAPGEPGDEALIQRLAKRIIDRYLELMIWSRDLRAARVPSQFQRVFQLAADMALRPVDEIREFVDDTVREMDSVRQRLADVGASPIEITLTLVVTMDEAVHEAFDQELERLLVAGF